jgi:hypothetical protein
MVVKDGMEDGIDFNNNLSYLRNGGMGWLLNVVNSYGLGHSSSHYV